MAGYYRDRLSGERLRACYEIAPPRVKRYLEQEIAVVLERTESSMRVLELGCGYGRVLARLSPRARATVGIDNSIPSLRLAAELLRGDPSVHLLAMDAARLGLRGGRFDLTICVQNGISAIGVAPETLLREAVRVTRSGGVVLLSSYSARFWSDRLEWFEIQAAHGLLGPIDAAATGDGVIVCEDGFRATTMSARGFADLAERLRLAGRVFEVDESSVFCEISVP